MLPASSYDDTTNTLQTPSQHWLLLSSLPSCLVNVTTCRQYMLPLSLYLRFLTLQLHQQSHKCLPVRDDALNLIRILHRVSQQRRHSGRTLGHARAALRLRILKVALRAAVLGVGHLREP